MLKLALKNWWLLTVKGILTMLFGLTALFFPVETMVIAAKFFGILLIFSGLTLVIFSVSRKKTFDRSWKLTEGYIDIIIGIVIFSFPNITPGMFISLIAIWISFMGFLQISNGYRLRSLYHHWRLLIFNGILAIGFSALILTQPVHGMVSIVLLMGLQALVFGGFLIVSSLYIMKLLNDISIDIPQKEGEDANQELSYY